MSEIRERLKEKHPELYEALERSWGIAQNQWLPAVKTASGSFNSYPHVKNLESYLDHVLLEYEKVGAEHELTGAEIYVICAAILFHDMGRINILEEGHGTTSKEMLLEDYGILGVPSKELAKIIGDICEFHKPKRGITPQLLTVSVTPYGKIRKRELAALLMLLDQMDSAFTRVIPNYLRSFQQMDVKGAFRSIIKDVYVSPRSQTLYTVIDRMSPPTEAHDLEKNFSFWDIGDGTREEWCCGDINKNKFPKGAKNYLFAKNRRRNPQVMADVFGKSVGLEPLEMGIAMGYLLIKDGKEWQSTTLLAVILGDLKRNISVLDKLRDNLAKLGIHIRKWRLEYDERLYDEEGTETYEGVFFPEYLLGVTRQMWDLSTQIFGSSELTYENLAAVIPESDIEKVKMAVRRLSLMSKSLTDDKEPGILSGQKRWKWRMKWVDGKCEYMSPQKLFEKLNELKKAEEKKIRQ